MKFEFGVLVFVEEGKCREPREKRKIGENPGTLLRINSKCNSVITLDLITLMGGRNILSTVPPFLSSWLVLFDNRLEQKWPIDNIAMCSVYYTYSSVTDVFKLKEKLHLPHEMRKRRSWKLDKREGQPLKASWRWVCHCALYWLHQGRIIKNKTKQLCLLCL